MAIHEAGHMVIAKSFGIVCEGELYPTFTNDPGRGFAFDLWMALHRAGIEAGHSSHLRDRRLERGERYLTWEGETRFRKGRNGKALKLKPGKRKDRLVESSQKEMRMVAVAGVIATAYWFDRKWFHDAPPDIEWHDPGVMSETDWEAAGYTPGEPDKKLFTAADEVAALLMPDGGPLWPEVLRIARDLIEDSRDIVGDDAVTVSRWISEGARADNSGAAELTAR
jgi:hypothetical protein